MATIIVIKTLGIYLINSDQEPEHWLDGQEAFPDLFYFRDPKLHVLRNCNCHINMFPCTAANVFSWTLKGLNVCLKLSSIRQLAGL